MNQAMNHPLTAHGWWTVAPDGWWQPGDGGAARAGERLDGWVPARFVWFPPMLEEVT